MDACICSAHYTRYPGDYNNMCVRDCDDFDNGKTIYDTDFCGCVDGY
jgi:hypothetical protein